MWECKSVRRILENLLVNAVNHGELSRPIIISLTEQSDTVFFSIKNSGNPIDKESSEKTFDPFFRITNETSKQGWGLCLAIVRGLINSLSGTISVKREQQNVFCRAVAIKHSSAFINYQEFSIFTLLYFRHQKYTIQKLTFGRCKFMANTYFGWEFYVFITPIVFFSILILSGFLSFTFHECFILI